MQIDITAESLLKQLKLDMTDNSLTQMGMVIDNTPHALKFFKHLFSLNDVLTPLDAFIAPSSSCNHLKIKYHGSNPAHTVSFHETVKHWADKYKVLLEKLDHKEVYYIKGMLS